MSTAVAKVAFLQGQAWAKAPDGTLRALTVGSTLNDDDILVTAQGSRVELDVGNGEPLIVNGGLEVGMSRDFLADTATETDEALLSDASVQEALTVLEQGGDLLDELEETAAGDNTGGGSDGNSSFVRLARVVEGTGSQSFGFDPQGTNASTVANNEGDYINRAPLVTDQTLASNEDEVLIGQIIASDIEGDTMTYALTSAPANGTLLLDSITGQFSFTPNTNYNGSDSFVVTVTDSRGNASSTTISLNILPVNDAPTTNDINLTTDEDIPVSGQVVAEDIEGDTLTYSISGQPANGIVVLDPATGAFVYTPNPDYNGSDVFIVTVDDGNGGTTTSTVRIGINPVNDAPVSSDQNLVTDEDTPIDGQVVATDVDGDILGYSVSGQPTNGVVVLNPATGGFTYSPNANYNGSDSFVVTISDGNGGTTTSRINIGINPVNDAPESADQNLTTPEDTPLNGQVVATDVENATLAYAVSGQPTNGSVTLNPATGEFVYTPNANYNGSDSFVVTIDDGNGGTTTSRINIGVTPVNDAPESADQNLTTPEDTPLNGQVVASDVENDTLAYSVSGQPTNGSVTLNPATGVFVYTPNANYNGSDSFVVTIDDGNGGSTTSLINIGVTPVNDVPVSADQNLTTPEDTPLNGQVVATDVENDTLAYTVSGQPTNGSVTLNPATGVFVYTPNANYNGSDSFVVTIDDGNGGTTTSLINIGVTPVNDAPVSADQNLITPEDTPLNGQVVAADVENDTLAYAVSGQPTNGSVTLNTATGVFVYTPNANYNGSDSFVVTIDDGNGGTTTSRINIGVTPVNDAPVSSNLNLTTPEDTPISSQISASDVDGDSLTFTVTGAPGNGTVSLDPATGSFTYSPSLSYNGSDSFVVAISDGNGGTTTSTVNIGVTPVNGAPTATNLNLTTDEGVPANGAISANDPDGDTLSYTVTGSPANGTVVLNPVTGTFSYTPATGYSGSDSFVVTINDGQGGSTTSTVTIGVTPAPVTTVSSIDSPSITEGGDLEFTVTLSGPAISGTNLAYSLGGGSADAADYGTATFSDGVTLVGGNLIIPIGVSSFTVTVPTVNDVITEPTETLPLSVGGVTGTGSIVDNDPAPKISMMGVTGANEGDNLTSFVRFDKVLDAPYTLSYTINGVTASPADYGVPIFSDGVTIVGEGLLLIPAGIDRFNVTLPSVDDTIDEPDETVAFTFGGLTLSGLIFDNDAPPSVSIDSVSVNEGDGTATFTVTLSAPSGKAISVNYASSDGSALAGSDYTAVSGTLNFAAGETSKTITVNIADDSLFENSENFTVTLSNPNNVVLGTAIGTATIVDNDGAPSVSSVSSPSVTEGGNLEYTVTLSGVSATETSLAFNLGGGSAVAADIGTPTFSDGVTLVGGNLLIPAGVTNFTVTVPTVDDLLNESTETLPLTVGGVTGTGSILDDDAAPSISIDSVSVNEADGTATFTVTLSAASGQAVSVDYASTDGSGTAGSDYAAVSGTLNFAAGETTKTITVSITDDNLFEGSENFTINLSNPSNAVLGTPTGTGTIVDNDSAPTVSSISSPSITEGGDLVYSVALSNPSTTVTSLAYSLGGGSAVAADIGTPTFSDGVTLVGGNLLIPAGVTSFTVTVSTIDDAITESTESLPLTVGGVTGTGNIIDNDASPNVAPVATDDPASTLLTAGRPASIDFTWSQPFISSISASGGSLKTNNADGVSGAIGVTGPGTTAELDDEIQNGESILVTLNAPVLSASFGFAKLDFTGVPETGLWIAYLDGVEVGRGQFNPTDTTRAGTVEVKDTSGNSIAFNQLKFDTATANSDYVVSWLTVGRNTATVQEGMSVAIPAGTGVLANDSDSDGGTLVVAGVRTGAEAGVGTDGTLGVALQGVYGKLTLNADGSYSYAADNIAALHPGQIAKDYFTYTLSDGQGGTDKAALTISVFGAMGSDNQFYGTAGNDALSGTSGADFISAAAGNDTMTGGLGADTFKWALADKGSAGTPATDVIQDFSTGQGDVLHLSELLQGENSSNLTDYLHFTYDAGLNQTTVHVSSAGGYSAGYNVGATDQVIVLNSHSVTGTNQEIINLLKASGNLITD